jgi:3'-phosphoadenosine 5'-phosphosulfate sulfotransferase (PAPS reductase)/FAD synthetase
MVLQPDPLSPAADREWVASCAAPTGAREVLAAAFERFGTQAVLATSFGPEDIVLLHLAAQQLGGSALQVFTIDTGRLPAETFEVMQAVVERFGLSLQTLVLLLPREFGGAQRVLLLAQSRAAVARASRPARLDHRHAARAERDPR